MMWWWGVVQRMWDSILWDPRPRPTHELDDYLVVSPDGYYGYATPSLDGADQLAEKEAQEEVSEPRYCNKLLSGLYCALPYGHDDWHFATAGGPHIHPSAVVPAEPADSEEGVSVSPPAPPSSRSNDKISWQDWAIPGICEILAEHFYYMATNDDDYSYCACRPAVAIDDYYWREHVSPLIAAHLEQAMEKRDDD